MQSKQEVLKLKATELTAEDIGGGIRRLAVAFGTSPDEVCRVLVNPTTGKVDKFKLVFIFDRLENLCGNAFHLTVNKIPQLLQQYKNTENKHPEALTLEEQDVNEGIKMLANTLSSDLKEISLLLTDPDTGKIDVFKMDFLIKTISTRADYLLHLNLQALKEFLNDYQEQENSCFKNEVKNEPLNTVFFSQQQERPITHERNREENKIGF